MIATESSLNLFNLEGRRAIVTGASRGIGFALAAGLAQAGAHVLAVSRSVPTFAPGLSIRHLSLDVRDAQAAEADVQDFAGDHGIDILVNAAGISIGGATELAPTLLVNLEAPFAFAGIVRPLMRRAGGGSIVNIASLGAHRGFPGNPAYQASKAGLLGLTRALAYDFAVDRIRVNSLTPGYIETDMTRASFEDPVRHEARRAHTMLGRWGTPADLVGATIFLCSDAAAYVTGQDIAVDGGWLAKGLIDTSQPPL